MRPGLTDADIDRLLDGLAVAAERILAEADAAEKLDEETANAFDDLPEPADHEHVNGSPKPPDPVKAAMCVRADLASEAAVRHRKAAREFVAWWADVATCAVVAAASETEVSAVRAAAADPSEFLDETQLAELPGPAEHDRELARLTASIAALPNHVGDDGPDLAALAREHAARHGLLVYLDRDGEIVVADDGTPDGRRRRLWGRHWIVCQAPLLPEPAALRDLLLVRGVAPAVVARAHRAAREVADLVAGVLRADQLEDAERRLPVAVIDEIDALRARAFGLTGVLAEYARVLTDCLPEVREPVADPRL